jgi:NAD(P)-dependent dehydrogenase (short-subunit alcohol dehydrogenase family)
MGRVALVTGASSGIGRVMALSLLKAGHRVVLSATDAVALEDVRSASQAGNRAAVVPADLSKESGLPLLARAAEDAFGQVDILVNNAGVPGNPGRRPQDVDLREMRRVFEINTYAPAHLTQLLVPGMIRRGWGRIVFVSTSLDTMLRFVPYGMTKAAGEAFMAALSVSLQSTGVTANVLLPGGMTATRMTQPRGDTETMLQPEIMGPPITWLASDASDHVTGRRFIAARWNPTLTDEQAAQAAGSPVAWGGDRAISSARRASAVSLK